MAIRKVLVALDPRNTSAPGLVPARELAERLGAKLSVCAAAEPWLDRAGGEMGPAEAAFFEEQRTEIEEGLADLEKEFNTVVPPAMQGEVRMLIAPPTGHLIDSALVADLVVLSSTSGTSARAIGIDVGDVIVGSGRPVLVVPGAMHRVDLQHIVIAWKDTREGRRALADAMPLLELADDVFVASIDEGSYEVEHGSFKDVLAWLGAHGIKATGEILPIKGTVGDTIEGIAASRGADLVVSGGYGHARFREWLFGGVTRTLLQSTNRAHLFSY